MFRPNFGAITRSGDNLTATGASDPEAFSKGEILDIRVMVIQGETIAGPVSVDEVSDSWSATLPAKGFEDGTCVAFGIETHNVNATTITWSEALPIL